MFFGMVDVSQLLLADEIIDVSLRERDFAVAVIVFLEPFLFGRSGRCQLG